MFVLPLRSFEIPLRLRHSRSTLPKYYHQTPPTVVAVIIPSKYWLFGCFYIVAYVLDHNKLEISILLFG